MRTTLYLIRHGATPANLTKPAKLQGRGTDTELAPLGIRQATATRDFLAVRAVDAVYSSPLKRAHQTACIIADPHGLTPVTVEALTECDVGRWEGKSWEEIQQEDPKSFAAYHADPAAFGYLGGENFAEVHRRAAAAIGEIMERHPGQSIVVVSHHVVNRTYLSGVLGLGPSKARMVSLDNCGISVVIREKNKTSVSMLNTSFHLQGVAA